MYSSTPETVVHWLAVGHDSPLGSPRLLSIGVVEAVLACAGSNLVTPCSTPALLSPTATHSLTRGHPNAVIVAVEKYCELGVPGSCGSNVSSVVPEIPVHCSTAGQETSDSGSPPVVIRRTVRPET